MYILLYCLVVNGFVLECKDVPNYEPVALATCYQDTEQKEEDWLPYTLKCAIKEDDYAPTETDYGL